MELKQIGIDGYFFQLILDPNVDCEKTQIQKRSWRECLFSRPWRPWLRYKRIVMPVIYMINTTSNPLPQSSPLHVVLPQDSEHAFLIHPINLDILTRSLINGVDAPEFPPTLTLENVVISETHPYEEIEIVQQ